MIIINKMETLTNNQYLLHHHTKFFLLLLLQIPLIILYLIIFAFFITNHTLLSKYHNQALFILFIVNFIQLSFDLPMSIHFYYVNHVSPSTETYCKWWMFFELTLDTINKLLVAIISIQRHILIFQPNILCINLKRYLLYYLPLLLCVFYPIIFYMATIVFYSCDDNTTQWDLKENMCRTTCYLTNDKTTILVMFDSIVNTDLPIIIIILANLMLVIRVIRHKHRKQRRAISRSKQRRMTLQLLSISSLHLFMWSHSTIKSIELI